MIIKPIRTDRVSTDSISLIELINSFVPTMSDGDILAITSKVVSLCEGSTEPMDQSNKEALIQREAGLRLPRSSSAYGIAFTVTNHTLIPTAGIDESNGDGYYVLWPKDSQRTANEVRQHLATKHGLTKVGVIITDSTSQPLRLGTVGIALAHSGFASLNDYVGKPDLFSKPFTVSKSNVTSGLAAAAVVTMGEGSEQTPLCLISDVPFVQFQDRDPSEAELADQRLSIEDDLFAPFLTNVPWVKGAGNQGQVS